MSNTSPFSVKDTGGQNTKVDFVIGAFSQLRISGLTKQPSPEDLEVALNRLEDMAAEFQSRNICTGYNFEDTPDPNSDTNVKRAYWQAYITNLAFRLIPDYNTQAPQALIMQANQSLANLSGRSALERLNQVQYPTRMPRGSGSTLRYNRWARFYRDVATVNSCASESMFIGDVNDFNENFDAYLHDCEEINSFTITADSAITILDSTNTNTDVLYTVQASSSSQSSNSTGGVVTIVITTDEGRVETRQTTFDFSARNTG